jgi:hypothetical protein
MTTVSTRPDLKQGKADASDEANPVGQAWRGLIQVATTVAGLTVLVYLVGAATLWLRFEAAGLPADVAVENYSRGQVIALGLRGVIVVFVVTAFVGAVFYVLLWRLFARAEKRKEKINRGQAARLIQHVNEPGRLRNTLVIDLAAPRVHAWSLSVYRIGGVIAALLLIVAAFINWQVFGVVLELVVVMACVLRYLHLRAEGKRPSVLVPIAAVLAGAFAGLAWQISGNIPAQAVFVRPQGIKLTVVRMDMPIPYFGETGERVYVGDVRVVDGKPKYCHRVIELRRDKVRLRFESRKPTFQNSLRPPAIAILDIVHGHGIANPSQPAVCQKPPA